MKPSIILVQVLAIVLAFNASHGQERPRPSRASAPASSCDQFLPAPKQVGTRQIGPEACAIVSEEVVFNGKGQPYERRELRITGTVTGWAAKQGPRFNYFNDAPDLVYAQSGNTNERFQGIGRYSASTGHGISLFLPADPAHWNGKLFVTAHGAGAYAAVGALLPRHPDDDPGTLAGVNRYVALMLDKGYAVAHTLRSSQLTGGDVTVTLEDGTPLTKYNVSSHAGFIRDFARIATKIVQQKLGRKPAKTYFYGFSAGGFLGRLVQYHPGFNVDPAGGRPFDGFLLDDAGGGLWLPVRMENGRDTLFLDDADRGRFVPQIDVTHQLYMGETGDYLDKKRENTRLLRRKGLGAKHRMYEIRGVSHFDAGSVSRPDLAPQTLDLSGVVDALIDALDRWVDKGHEPPPTKSDLPELGGPALALPEVACPLGRYYAHPAVLGDTRRGGQETGFAAFDGVNQEPIDGRGELVDLNGNGTRDRRETVAQAWARLGLLESGQPLSQGRYVACVANAAAKLVADGFLPPRLLAHYVRRAVGSNVGHVER